MIHNQFEIMKHLEIVLFLNSDISPKCNMFYCIVVILLQHEK